MTSSMSLPLRFTVCLNPVTGASVRIAEVTHRGRRLAFRLDRRNKAEGWRVDVSGFLGWEAIDEGKGFPTVATAKVWAQHYFFQMVMQGTFTPNIKR